MKQEDMAVVRRFLDEEGRVTALPQKQGKRRLVLSYLAESFACGRDYTEKEVNALLDARHTFGDFFLLRRELCDSGLLQREQDGSRYWRPQKEE